MHNPWKTIPLLTLFSIVYTSMYRKWKEKYNNKGRIQFSLFAIVDENVNALQGMQQRKNTALSVGFHKRDTLFRRQLRGYKPPFLLFLIECYLQGDHNICKHWV